MKYSNPVVILGSARSGTTVMSRILREHPQAFMTMEALQYSHNDNNFDNFIGFVDKAVEHYKDNGVDGLNRPQDRLGISIVDCKREGRSKEMIDKLKLLDLSVDNRFQSLDRFWEAILDDKEIVYGDKRPEYIHEIDYIKDNWPSAKFIHTIRDPRDIWLSQVRHYKNKVAQDKRPHFWMVETIQEAIHAETQTGQGMNAVERMCLWLLKRDQIGQNGIEVYYKDMVKNPSKILTELSEFLGISYKGLEKTYEKYFKPTHFQQWKKEGLEIKDEIPEWQREVFRQYGFKL